MFDAEVPGKINFIKNWITNYLNFENQINNIKNTSKNINILNS